MQEKDPLGAPEGILGEQARAVSAAGKGKAGGGAAGRQHRDGRARHRAASALLRLGLEWQPSTCPAPSTRAL